MSDYQYVLAVLPFLAAGATWIRNVETRLSKHEEREEQDAEFRDDVKLRFNRVEDKLDRAIERLPSRHI